MFESYFVNEPKPGESLSGDAGIIELLDDRLFACLIDVAGHGKVAHELAVNSEGIIRDNLKQTDLKEITRVLHEYLRCSRGAVVSLLSWNLTSNEVHYLGVGNVYGRIFGTDRGGSLVNCSGLVGQNLPSFRLDHKVLNPGECLVLCSDGVSSHALNRLSMEFFQADARKIAKQLVSRFGKDTDDASCIVLRNIGRS